MSASACGLLLTLAGCAALGRAPESAPDVRQSPREDAPALNEHTGEGGASEPPRTDDSPRTASRGGTLSAAAKELSRLHFEMAMHHYDAFEYGEALKGFARALELTPEDPDVLHYELVAELLASETSETHADFVRTVELLRDQKEVAIQQAREDLQRLYREGETRFERQELEGAVELFEQVLETIRWFPYEIDTENLEENARAYLARARRHGRE